jgi:hypothetical protein
MSGVLLPGEARRMTGTLPLVDRKDKSSAPAGVASKVSQDFVALNRINPISQTGIPSPPVLQFYYNYFASA